MVLAHIVDGFNSSCWNRIQTALGPNLKLLKADDFIRDPSNLRIVKYADDFSVWDSRRKTLIGRSYHTVSLNFSIKSFRPWFMFREILNRYDSSDGFSAILVAWALINWSLGQNHEAESYAQQMECFTKSYCSKVSQSWCWLQFGHNWGSDGVSAHADLLLLFLGISSRLELIAGRLWFCALPSMFNFQSCSRHQKEKQKFQQDSVTPIFFNGYFS